MPATNSEMNQLRKSLTHARSNSRRATAFGSTLPTLQARDLAGQSHLARSLGGPSTLTPKSRGGNLAGVTEAMSFRKPVIARGSSRVTSDRGSAQGQTE